MTEDQDPGQSSPKSSNSSSSDNNLYANCPAPNTSPMAARGCSMTMASMPTSTKQPSSPPSRVRSLSELCSGTTILPGDLFGPMPSLFKWLFYQITQIELQMAMAPGPLLPGNIAVCKDEQNMEIVHWNGEYYFESLCNFRVAPDELCKMDSAAANEQQQQQPIKVWLCKMVEQSLRNAVLVSTDKEGAPGQSWLNGSSTYYCTACHKPFGAHANLALLHMAMTCKANRNSGHLNDSFRLDEEHIKKDKNTEIKIGKKRSFDIMSLLDNNNNSTDREVSVDECDEDNIDVVTLEDQYIHGNVRSPIHWGVGEHAIPMNHPLQMAIMMKANKGLFESIHTANNVVFFPCANLDLSRQPNCRRPLDGRSTKRSSQYRKRKRSPCERAQANRSSSDCLAFNACQPTTAAAAIDSLSHLNANQLTSLYQSVTSSLVESGNHSPNTLMASQLQLAQTFMANLFQQHKRSEISQVVQPPPPPPPMGPVHAHNASPMQSVFTSGGTLSSMVWHNGALEGNLVPSSFGEHASSNYPNVGKPPNPSEYQWKGASPPSRTSSPSSFCASPVSTVVDPPSVPQEVVRCKNIKPQAQSTPTKNKKTPKRTVKCATPAAEVVISATTTTPSSIGPLPPYFMPPTTNGSLSQHPILSSIYMLSPSLTALSYQASNVCAYCQQAFRMTSDLVYHMRSHHKKSVRNDDVDGKGLNGEDEAKMDGKKAKRDQPSHPVLKCNICLETFRERHHLTRHMTSHQ